MLTPYQRKHKNEIKSKISSVLFISEEYIKEVIKSYDKYIKVPYYFRKMIKLIETTKKKFLDNVELDKIINEYEYFVDYDTQKCVKLFLEQYLLEFTKEGWEENDRYRKIYKFLS